MKLPEKEWLSIGELAARWNEHGVGHLDILHYMETGKLSAWIKVPQTAKLLRLHIDENGHVINRTPSCEYGLFKILNFGNIIWKNIEGTRIVDLYNCGVLLGKSKIPYQLAAYLGLFQHDLLVMMDEIKRYEQADATVESDKKKLPENEWFSLEEVADRLQTDVERIKHYLTYGKLMPCLRQGRELMQIENYYDMQWEYSWQAEASFCDLAKCKIRLSQAGNEAVHWSGSTWVSEDDLLISLSEVQRFEKACEPNTGMLLSSDYLEERGLRKQQIDALPYVCGVRSASTLTGVHPEDSVSVDPPEQHLGHIIVPVPVEEPAVPLAPIGDVVEQVEEAKQPKKRKSTKDTTKHRLDRSVFWTAVEAWVKTRCRAGQPSIGNFRQAVRQDPGSFDLDGTIEDYPSPGDDGKYYYCLATGAEISEGTVKNRLGKFYKKACIKKTSVTE